MQLFTEYILYRYIESKNIEDNMSSIQVTKQENSWQVVTSNGTYTVEDTNGNGKMDKKDVWTSANGGTLPSVEEREEAMGLAMKKEKMTAEEMDQYERYQEQLKLKQQRQQQQQQYQQQSQTPKKMNFWQKFSMMSTAMLPLFGGLTGMFAGMGMGSWAYNSGHYNDTALRIMGGTTGALFGLSSMMSTVAMMKGMNNMPAGGYNCGGFNNNFGSGLQQAMEAQNQWQQAQQQRWDEYAEKVKEESEKRAEKAKKQQNQKTVQDAIASNTDCNDKNREYLDSLEDLDGEREYTDEEVKNVKKIKMAPSIPVNHIGDDASDKTKLSPQFAQKLNKLIAGYEKYDNEGSDNKFKYLSKENYTKIKQILNKETLTETDVTELQNIYKAEIKRAKEEQ